MIGLVDAVLHNDVEKLGQCNELFLTQTTFTYENNQNNFSEELPFNGLTLLHLAAITDSLESFIYIERTTCFDFFTRSADNFTPLHYACFFKSYEIISYIIAKAKYNKEAADKLHILYKEDACGSNGKSLMRLATISLSTEVMKLLFESGYELTESIRTECVNIAVNKKSVDVLLLLLQKSSGKDSSPLITAISNNNFEAIPILIQANCNLEYCTSDYTTALSAACMQSQVDIVRMLCEKMTKIDIQEGIKENAACHWICTSGSPEIAEIMLQHDINVNRLNANDKTCVSVMNPIIPEEDDIKILELLVENGFNINHTPNSPIANYVTGIRKKPKVVAWFLEHGFNPNVKMNDRFTFKEYFIRNSHLFPGIDPKYLN